MMNLPPGTRVYLCCRPTDMRKGMNGLAAQVSNILHADPYSGHLFVFRSKRADYVKILYWDGSGLCLFGKRLEKSRFVWPPIIDGSFHMSTAQLALLLEGMDWRRTVPIEMPRQPVFV
jgi:transposase